MDIKAFRQDLAQKAFDAKKTNFSEDKINVTYSGQLSEESAEYYRTVVEHLKQEADLLESKIREISRFL
jgi:hypothetical protein